MIYKLKPINEVTKTIEPKKPNLNIAIIDDFSNKSVFIDSDDIPDVAHGKVVERFIKEGLPDAQISEFDIKNAELPTALSNINNQLDNVLREIKNGKKFDALNISLSDNSSFETLSEILGVRLSPWGTAKYRDELRQIIKKGAQVSLDQNATEEEIKTHNNAVELNDIITKIDEISSTGVNVFMSAGNTLRDTPGKTFANNLNLFSLAKTYKTVGAKNERGSTADFSNYNDLVNEWEKGVFHFKTMTDKNGEEGIDYTGDGTIDIYKKDLSSQNIMDGIQGTSFATPLALVKDFKNRKEKAEIIKLADK